MKLEQKRKLWALATPGPLVARGISLQTSDARVELADFVGQGTSGHQDRANAQRCADSTHLPALVEALEKIMGMCCEGLTDDCAPTPSEVLDNIDLFAHATLKSLDDPEEKV